MPEPKVCKHCGETFFRKPKDRQWEKRLFCDRVCKDAYYRTTEKGKSVHRLSQARYEATGRGRATRLRRDTRPKKRASRRRYRITSAYAAKRTRYLASEKGKLYVQLKRLRWKGDPGGYAEFARNRYQVLFEEELPCTKCGEADVTQLECDHILARGLGGTHDRANLQVLCKQCHRIKTKTDARMIRAAKQQALYFA